ncbi:hypothetical protein A2U01_0010557 [Trifolium medium]|uniref:Uncharacterized protein n=1 Tax=Trifolium medium TaxID=97028 RepID=A0A392MQA3_9FABA|nr:hypothetical protein [Trifolium medium]
MKFMKNSWANLAEIEDEEIDNIEVAFTVAVKSNPLQPIEEPFQEVVSKKKSKKNKAANNKAYSTRYKVDQSSGGS